MPEDLVGHVLEKEPWEVVSIPAIETEDREYRYGRDPDEVYRRRAGEALHAAREPQPLLDQARRNLGSLNFAAQYQQNPLPEEGNIIRREWIRYYEQRPDPLDLIIVSWDTASTLAETSDYSVGTVWGLRGSEIYLLDVIRGRFETPDLRRRILDLHQQHHAHATLIEDSDIGRAIGQELRRSAALRPILPKVRFDKTARLLAESPKFEAGQVLLPREAPWLASYLDELLGFPNTRHDDQVDSTSQALRYLSAKIAQGIPRRRPDRIRAAGTQRRRGDHAHGKRFRIGWSAVAANSLSLGPGRSGDGSGANIFIVDLTWRARTRPVSTISQPAASLMWRALARCGLRSQE
jgi:predicted phage terminase large subunit-like protein